MIVSLSQQGPFLLVLWFLPWTLRAQWLSYEKALTPILLNKHKIICHCRLKQNLLSHRQKACPFNGSVLFSTLSSLIDSILFYSLENRALTVHVGDGFFSKAFISRTVADPGILVYLPAKHGLSKIWDACSSCMVPDFWHFRLGICSPYPFLCLMGFIKDLNFNGPYVPCSEFVVKNCIYLDILSVFLLFLYSEVLFLILSIPN